MSNNKRSTEAEDHAVSSEASEKLKNKKYLKELATLHVELVKLQEWVRHHGLKV